MFTLGFLKTAAARSEIVGSAINPVNWVLSTPAGIAGLLVGPYSEKGRKEVNKKSYSNVLIPAVGPFRSGRRLAGMGLDKTERPD